MRLVLTVLLLASWNAQARELKIATWNLEWLTLRPAGDPALPDGVIPKLPEDRALLRRYAAALDADVVALQEVDGPQAAAEIFPPDRYALFFSRDRVVQRVGFAVRRGIAVEQNADLVGLDVQRNAPFPLRSGADITLDFPAAKLRLLALHLKSGCQQGAARHLGPHLRHAATADCAAARLDCATGGRRGCPTSCSATSTGGWKAATSCRRACSRRRRCCG